MQSQTPSIFAYTDFRLFLKDFYAHTRAKNPRFSHRYISSRLGFASSGWFGDVLKGRANLGSATIVKLAELLELREKEVDYLETLVLYNQSSTLEERNRHFRKLVSFKDRRVDLVGREQLEFFSSWYNTVIRELLFIHDFSGDVDALAKKLMPPIKPSQARDAMALLEKLGFVRKNAQGKYKPRESTLKKDPSFKSLYVANFLRTTMELAMTALEEVEKEERHISAITFSFSKKGFENAVNEIEVLRKRLMLLMEEDAAPERVYQFNIQFFPVTR